VESSESAKIATTYNEKRAAARLVHKTPTPHGNAAEEEAPLYASFLH
jgi:hypothetical protein